MEPGSLLLRMCLLLPHTSSLSGRRTERLVWPLGGQFHLSAKGGYPPAQSYVLRRSLVDHAPSDSSPRLRALAQICGVSDSPPALCRPCHLNYPACNQPSNHASFCYKSFGRLDSCDACAEVCLARFCHGEIWPAKGTLFRSSILEGQLIVFRIRSNSIKSPNFPMAFEWPLNLSLDPSRASVSMSMLDPDMRTRASAASATSWID